MSVQLSSYLLQQPVAIMEFLEKRLGSERQAYPQGREIIAGPSGWHSEVSDSRHHDHSWPVDSDLLPLLPRL
jgi:hypothetical protein